MVARGGARRGAGHRRAAEGIAGLALVEAEDQRVRWKGEAREKAKHKLVDGTLHAR